MAAQEFLNKQSIERVGNPELRTNSFDYIDVEGLLHRYLLSEVNKKGEIISYLEKVVNVFTEEQLYKKYGYFMAYEHGKDIGLLIDIMKCNGLDIECRNGKYLVLNK